MCLRGGGASTIEIQIQKRSPAIREAAGKQFLASATGWRAAGPGQKRLATADHHPNVEGPRGRGGCLSPSSSASDWIHGTPETGRQEGLQGHLNRLERVHTPPALPAACPWAHAMPFPSPSALLHDIPGPRSSSTAPGTRALRRVPAGSAWRRRSRQTRGSSWSRVPAAMNAAPRR